MKYKPIVYENCVWGIKSIGQYKQLKARNKRGSPTLHANSNWEKISASFHDLTSIKNVTFLPSSLYPDLLKEVMMMNSMMLLNTKIMHISIQMSKKEM